MKNITFKSLFILLIFAGFIACEDNGIDDITPIDPGVDAEAPIVKINTPPNGTSFSTAEDVISIDIKFEVTDDIEIANITVDLDGTTIATFSDFADYRRYLGDFAYDNITDGSHTLTVTAEDLSGKVTSESVTFEKVPAYVAQFDGEMFYMGFEGSYDDLISFNSGSEVGGLSFSSDPYTGASAFTAPTDSYLNYAISDLSESLGDEFSGSFWYKSSGDPNRAGIITVGDDADNRHQGFRLFREGNATEQRVKLNVGRSGGETWNDGGIVTVGEWTHMAFTISPSETKIYINGTLVNTGSMPAAIDWSDCEVITIGSGGPTFGYWNHKSDTNSSLDDLRFFNKALSQSEVLSQVAQGAQIFNMSFDGTFKESISEVDATVVGSPGFAGEAFAGSNAYKGATDAYLTFPLATIGLGQEFSAAFRYKVNASPDRAGLLVVGDDADDRRQGFRLFREGNTTDQRIKLNVGTGTGESWNDGGVISVADNSWVHVALTVSESESNIYFNGVLQNTAGMSAPIDWTGCSEIVIGSGGPTFDYWNHKSDESAIDELKLFNKALSQPEIQALL